MPRKRTAEELAELEHLKLSELAELNGLRYSTVKYYSELGLLPYEQKGARLAKYYPKEEASKRLKEIAKLKDKGKSIPEIISALLKV